jgi:hypothetical protein
MPSSVDLRDCRLYRFWVEHPVTGEEVLGYIGETVRQPVERMMEHLRDQPWFDTVTRWERDPQIFVGKPAVLEAERQAIRAEKPLYNVRENERNEERIPPPLAIRQRRARDAQRNAPRWVHPADRGDLPGPAPDRASPVRQRRSSGWRPWQRRLVGWGSAWLGSTAAAYGSRCCTGTWATGDTRCIRR